MKSYIDSVIGSDETVLYSAQVSLIAFLVSYVMGVVFFMALFFSLSTEMPWYFKASLFLLSMLSYARPIITYLTTELAITNKRIIAKFGLIRRTTIEINLPKVESISVNQSILGRIFDYGTLYIVGTGGTKEPIPSISNPLSFRRKFNEIFSD